MEHLKKIFEKIDYNKCSFWLYLFGCYLICYFIFFDHPLEEYLFSDMKIYLRRAIYLLEGKNSPYNTFHTTGLAYIIAIDEKFFVKDKFYLTKTIFYFMSILIPVMSGLAFQNIFNKKILWPIAAIIIFHFQLIGFSGYLMAEIPSSFFITLILLIGSYYKNSFSFVKCLLLGLIFSLSLIFKGNIAFFLPSFILTFIFYNRSIGQKILSLKLFKPIFAILISITTFFLIYGGINKKFFGYFHPLGTVGGVNFYMAKCPKKKMIDSEGRNLISPVHYQLGQTDEVKFNEPFYNSKYFYLKAIKCLLDDPKRIFYAFNDLSHMFDGTYVWPLVMSKKYSQLVHWLQNFYALLVFPGFLIFLLIFFRGEAYRNIILTSLILGSLILPLVFVGDVRYRSVFDPIFMPGALLGWIHIGNSSLFGLKEDMMIKFCFFIYFLLCIIPVSYNILLV
ncbi:hypothetical protein N9N67_06015 [Bacteriovoracaceae bacterium]|nr:hypothetical protein [Bacteriovoracaceae bacterium]